MIKDVTTAGIPNHNGDRVEVYLGLQPGQKLIAKRSTHGTSDYGATGLLSKCISFTEGHEYWVDRNDFYGNTELSYVIDEDGVNTWVTTDLFDIGG